MSGSPPRPLEASSLAARLGTPAVVAGLAAPLVLVAGAVALGIVQADRMIAAWSIRLWLAALGGCTAAGVAVALDGRRLARALALLAVAAVLVQLLAWGALRFEGSLAAGVGENDAPWERKEAGPLARPPRIEVLELPAGQGGLARLRVDGREVSLPLGPAKRIGGGTSLAVQGPFPAPAFEVLGPSGARVESGLVKIDPAKRDWFMVGFLPHRLYLRAPEGGFGADPRSPGRLHLRVQRGKIRVLDRDVSAGERVEFERLSFAFGPGDAWARVEVHREPPIWPGLAVAAALGCGALALAWTRRSVRP